MTKPGQAVGSLDYMAPEQIRGEKVTSAADVYSLGCVMFQCLAGEPPFADRQGMQILWAHLRDEPPDPCAKRPESLRTSRGPSLARSQGRRRAPGERNRLCAHGAGGRRGAAAQPRPRGMSEFLFVEEAPMRRARAAGASGHDDRASGVRRRAERSRRLAASRRDPAGRRRAGRRGPRLDQRDLRQRSARRRHRRAVGRRSGAFRQHRLAPRVQGPGRAKTRTPRLGGRRRHARSRPRLRPSSSSLARSPVLRSA